MSTNVETIKQEVIEQLSGDSRIDASNIEVSFHEGIVTLSGYVPDLSTRQRVPIVVSLLNGVNAVKNNLNVQYLTPDVDDAELQRRVTSAFDWFSGINANNIGVAVSDGIAALEGTVGGFMEKIMAENLASKICGIKDVISKIAVVPTKSYYDEEIAEKVTKSISRNTGVDASSVNIKVQNGIVTLSGTVPNGVSLHAVSDAAQVTPGVVDVVNNIAVKPS